jgi:hypothetical protein
LWRGAKQQMADGGGWVLGRHCEERSDEAIQSSVPPYPRLLVAARSPLFGMASCGTEDWIASLRSQ